MAICIEEPTQVEICDALMTIKQVCANHRNCYNCPLGNIRGNCMITAECNPDKWEIRPPQLDVWRAF